MIKKKYTEKQVTRKVVNECTYTCDICKKTMKIPQHYWLVSITKVNRSDNRKSIDAYDCCSSKCVQELYNKYFKESQESIDNNDWLEITHQHTRSVDEINAR